MSTAAPPSGDPPSRRPPLTPPPPLAALDYSQPVARARPGILTAVGVISICVGGLGILSNAASVLQAVVFAFLPTAAAMAPPPPAAPPAAVATAPSTAPPLGTSTVTLTPPNATPTPAGGVAARPGPVFGGLDRATAALALTEGLIGLALAVFLLVMGILVLRDAPFARRGHLIWAYLKLPAAVLTAWTTWHVSRAFMAGFNAAMPAGTPARAFTDSMAMLQAVFATVFACVYPTAVLVVMHTKTARAYYAAGGQALRT